MRFCTVINCMDGRVQLPVIDRLQDRYKVNYVDSITEAGPVRVLSDEWNSEAAKLIVERVSVLCGLAIVENSFDRTHLMKLAMPQDFTSVDQECLQSARSPRTG